MQVPAVLSSGSFWVLAGLLVATGLMIERERLQKQEDLQGVVISELMAHNTRTLIDEDGDTSDWIELLNRGAEKVDLEGSYLTDETTAPRKWALPSVVLEPGESLIVFASGKNRRDGELHTNFRLSDQGEFLGLVAADGTLLFGYQPEYPAQRPNMSFGLASGSGTPVLVEPDSNVRVRVPRDDRHDETWMQPDFDDAGWRAGRGAVGFEEGRHYVDLIDVPLESMFENASSAYLRIPFRVTDPGSITRLVLRIKYDDGFVAYLNGRRVAADNAPDEVSWDSRAPASRPDEEAMVYEEFDLSDGRHLLVQGDNVLAIHGLNRSPGSKDFLIAPVLWAARSGVESTDEPLFLEEPSPGRLNGAGFESVAEPPPLSVASGLYFGSVTVALESSPGGAVHYTLDGSLPDRSSPLYRGPLSFERSTVLTARQFVPDQAGSEPVRGHYVIADADLGQFDSDLPIVVVETFGETVTPDRFSSAFAHLFAGDGRTAVDRPAFQGEISIKHRGSTSLAYPKRSFAVETRDSLGRDRAVELLGMPADSDWILYAPYNYDRSLIRNALVYELSNRIGRYAPRTRFVEVFVHSDRGTVSRDDYWGVYVLMEKIKGGPHRVDVEEMTPSHRAEPEIAGGYIVKIDRRDPGDRGFAAGGQSHLNYVYPKEAYINPEQARWIRRYFDDFKRRLESGGYEEWIDVPSWIDYHILQELSRNPDGHRYSTFLFKPRAGKLAMGPLWDFDRAMGADDTQRSRTPPDPRPIGRSRVHSYGWWARLMADPELVRRYRDRWLELRQGPLQVDNVLAIIDGMAAELSESQARNFSRWPLDLGESGWPGKIEHLRTWIATRIRWMDGDLIGPPKSERRAGPSGNSFNVSPVAGGEIFYTLDGTDPRAEDGRVRSTAKSWNGPLDVMDDTVLSARECVTDDVWGALARWK